MISLLCLDFSLPLTAAWSDWPGQTSKLTPIYHSSTLIYYTVLSLVCTTTQNTQNQNPLCSFVKGALVGASKVGSSISSCQHFVDSKIEHC
uniref:Secreted protein n=1 Tax=Ixodes ricinus TaxID=34613 RepID=A0A0K8RDX7_IXORI